LEIVAKIIGANSVAAISFDDKIAATETLAALRAEPQILAACLYRGDGMPLAKFSREGFKATFPSTPGPDGSIHAGDRLTYFGGIEDEREHHRVGTLYFEADFSGLRQRLGSYAKLLALVLATSCVVALGLSALLQRYISEPVVKLASTIRKVSANRDYSLRVPLESGHEFGQLITGFNEMLQEIGTAHQELEAFSFSVSHDLRAPLRAVDGFSQALAEDFGPQLPEDGRHQLKMIRANAKRMGELIDDLLAFARLGRQPVRKQFVETEQLVRATLADLQTAHTGRQVEIKIGSLPSCKGDSSLLKQVWVNLLSNALKYTRRREKTEIEIGCVKTDGADTFFVRDNGTGFDMRYADRLFGVFQRLHREQDYEGTGVGLAIVQRIVNRHGGRVWVDAAVDRGATFFFTLEKEAKS
jgi:signal transduction histidine kinase